jgi:O-acetylhomoserine/O-acetylserine sulfhydrylase-like pyridoxal-dependent enzyme
VLNGLRSLQNLKELDLSLFIIKHLEEAEVLASYLNENQQLEKIQMPKM